jgi:hypothetical protein
MADEAVIHKINSRIGYTKKHEDVDVRGSNNLSGASGCRPEELFPTGGDDEGPQPHPQ